MLFSVLGTLETVTNLYFNNPLNLDLSEQEIISCSNLNGDCENGWSIHGSGNNGVLNYIKANGVSEEECYPYRSYTLPNAPCNKCSAPSENIKFNNIIGGYNSPSLSDEELAFFNNDNGGPWLMRLSDNIAKQYLFQYGPISVSISKFSHAMSLIGYKVLQANDVVFTEIQDANISIQPNDSRIGQTAWLFKNS